MAQPLDRAALPAEVIAALRDYKDRLESSILKCKFDLHKFSAIFAALGAPQPAVEAARRAREWQERNKQAAGTAGVIAPDLESQDGQPPAPPAEPKECDCWACKLTRENSNLRRELESLRAKGGAAREADREVLLHRAEQALADAEK